MKKLIINGRFLTQNITGVQRFAHEIIKELDKIVKKGEVKIIAPKNIIFSDLKYENIEIVTKGKLTGHLWEQLELPLYVKMEKGVLINLCNTAPIINPSIVTIHDIQTKVFPEFFSKQFSLWYNFINFFNTKRAKKIITVSEFSKKEIMKYYNVSSEKIEVIYNGWQHMERVGTDKKILDKLEIRGKEYILAVSSLNPNKNFKYVIELAKLHPEYKFIIAGKKNDKVFADGSVEELNNLVWAGYVSDEELKTLYSKAKSFVFPSFYEGFGIPPLEALACGCENIIVSNTSCLPEVFGESANYIDPNKVERIRMEDKKEEIGKILEKYSWRKSAEKIKEIGEE